MSSKLVDEEFKFIGKKPELIIWRIENFKLIRIPPNNYGTFYTGDSYLVFNAHGNIESLRFDIHFWLGKDSTLDEMATAAYKAVELDDHLGGGPVQYREVQNHESILFKSYFKNGIRYKNGGINSGFKSIKDIESLKRLYMVKGKNDIRVIEVEFSELSLNKSDVFILEDGLKIFQWNPPGANKLEKMNANVYAKQIRDNDHAGKATILILEDDWDSNTEFWAYFNCSAKDIKETSEFDDKQFEGTFKAENITLYRISDSKSDVPVIKKVANGPLKKRMLDSNDCFIVDCGLNGIYTWVGKKCTKNEKIASIKATKEIMVKNNYPNYIPMAQLVDGAETTAFKSIFDSWN